MRIICLALVVVALGASALSLAACGGHAAAPSPSPSPSPSSPSPLPTASSNQTFNVRAFGATGNGSSDDSAALHRALASAARVGGAVYLPAGTYNCATTVTLPNGVRVSGDGDSSWLKGKLVFGSGDVVKMLKIGNVGQCAVTNAADASATTFVDCRLHGGGSTSDENSSVLYLGGNQGNVSGVTFMRCQIERTSYVPPPGVNAYDNGVGNTITIHEFSYLRHSGHVERITFRDCYLGASNGRASGALRMLMEAFTWDNRTGLVYHGWRDLTFEGCTIAASDTAGLDFADKQVSSTGAHSSSGVVIDGCTFLGAAKDRGSGHGGNPVTYECPSGIVITNNTFYATPQQSIGGSHVGQRTTSAPGLLIQGNTFDMTHSPVGLRHETGSPCINLVGFKSRVIGNTFIYDAGLGVAVEADQAPAARNVIQGNTFTDLRSSGGEPTIQFVDQGPGCYQNSLTGNTITNRAAGAAGVIAQLGGGPNFVTGNTIDCGKAPPFFVQSGKLVHSGNRIN